MPVKDRIYLFHIFRKDGTSLFLNPFGSPDKFVANNEKQTVVIQRRCLRAARPIIKGEIITRSMIDVLRPATNGAILPDAIE